MNPGPLDNLRDLAAQLDAAANDDRSTADALDREAAELLERAALDAAEIRSRAEQHRLCATRKVAAVLALRGQDEAPPPAEREPEPTDRHPIAAPVVAEVTSLPPAPVQADRPPLVTGDAEVTSSPSAEPETPKRSAHDKVDCDICGRAVNWSAMTIHRGSRPCRARRAASDEAKREVAPAQTASPAPLAPSGERRAVHVPMGPAFRKDVRSLFGRGMGRTAICEAIGMLREELDAILADEREPDAQELRRLQDLRQGRATAPEATEQEPGARGSALRAVEAEARGDHA